MGFDNRFDDCQADSRSSGFPGPGFVSAIEALKDLGQIFRGDADACILDADNDLVLSHARAHPDRTPGMGVFQRICQQIDEHLAQLVGVTLDNNRFNLDA